MLFFFFFSQMPDATQTVWHTTPFQKQILGGGNEKHNTQNGVDSIGKGCQNKVGRRKTRERRRKKKKEKKKKIDTRQKKKILKTFGPKS